MNTYCNTCYVRNELSQCHAPLYGSTNQLASTHLLEGTEHSGKPLQSSEGHLLAHPVGGARLEELHILDEGLHVWIELLDRCQADVHLRQEVEASIRRRESDLDDESLGGDTHHLLCGDEWQGKIKDI